MNQDKFFTEKCFLELQKAIELIKKKNSINFMYFHQTELFTDFSQETNIMQTGRGTVKYWLGLHIFMQEFVITLQGTKSDN